MIEDNEVSFSMITLTLSNGKFNRFDNLYDSRHNDDGSQKRSGSIEIIGNKLLSEHYFNNIN